MPFEECPECFGTGKIPQIQQNTALTAEVATK